MFSRNYGDSHYSLQIERPDIAVSPEAEPVTLSTTIWYDRFFGTERFKRDEAGHVSETRYDKLGRVVFSRKPDDSDGILAGDDPAQFLSALSDNPAIEIGYNDLTNTVTVRAYTGDDTDGRASAYDFDAGGRIRTIERSVRAIDGILSSDRVEKVSATYDAYDQAISITDPLN